MKNLILLLILVSSCAFAENFSSIESFPSSDESAEAQFAETLASVQSMVLTSGWDKKTVLKLEVVFHSLQNGNRLRLHHEAFNIDKFEALREDNGSIFSVDVKSGTLSAAIEDMVQIRLIDPDMYLKETLKACMKLADLGIYHYEIQHSRNGLQIIMYPPGIGFNPN